ncbi:hypothetical protein ACU4HD_36590 [Cupriavidus basilensis]
MAGIAAAVVALLVFVMWSWLVLWVRWNGREPVDWLVFGTGYTAPVLSALSALALGLTLIAGRFAGFLNLSTLQQFYSARLTRAYLGGSNGQRFAPGSGAAPAQQHASQRARLSVAEPEAGDALSLNTYYDPAMLAPLHLINVTLNLTVDPAEQLVQARPQGQAAVHRARAFHAAAHGHARRARRFLRALHRGRAVVLPGDAQGGRRRAVAVAHARRLDRYLRRGDLHRAGPFHHAGHVAVAGAGQPSPGHLVAVVSAGCRQRAARRRRRPRLRAGGPCRVALAGRLYHAVPHPVLPGLRAERALSWHAARLAVSVGRRPFREYGRV